MKPVALISRYVVVALGLLALKYDSIAQDPWQWVATDPQGGSWFDKDNWSNAAVPGSSRSPKINNGGLAILSGSSSQIVDLYVGDTTKGNRFEISEAGFNTRSIYIGNGANSEGSVHLKAGTVWTASSNGQILVGYWGSGTLIIDAGATLNSSHTTMRIANSQGSTGAVTLNGTWLIGGGELELGFGGVGTMTIGAGGFLDLGSGGLLSMAAYSPTDSFGTLNIGGAVVSGTASAAAAAGTLNTVTIRGGSSKGTGGASTINFNHTDARYEFKNSAGDAIEIIGNAKTTVNFYSGTTVLSASNTYKGETVVYGGTLLANHTGDESSTGTGQVRVEAEGTLGGIGIISGAALIKGTLAPGDGANGYGVLSFESTVGLGSESVTLFRIGGSERGSSYDALDIGGKLTFDGKLKITLQEGFALAGGEKVSFTLFQAGSYEGSFAELDLQQTWNGFELQWDSSKLYTEGILSVTAAIPEPRGASLLMGLGGLWIAAACRRSMQQGAFRARASSPVRF